MNPTTTIYKHLLGLRFSHQEALFVLTGDQGARTWAILSASVGHLELQSPHLQEALCQFSERVLTRCSPISHFHPAFLPFLDLQQVPCDDSKMSLDLQVPYNDSKTAVKVGFPRE